MKIEIDPEWHFMSSLLGFYRVLKNTNIEITDDLEFNDNILLNFASYYFDYFLRTYNTDNFNKVRANIINRYLQNESIYGNKIKDKNLQDMYFNDYIVPIFQEHTKKKYKCTTCNNSLYNPRKGLSFLKNTGFDIQRKNSCVYNFNNDIMICPVCRLIYTCMPAGFENTRNSALFINDNITFKNTMYINDKLNEFINTYEDKKYLDCLLYKFIIDNIDRLVDIQLIFYENDKYYSYFISKKLADAIKDNRKELYKIEYYSYIKDNKHYFILNEIMKRLMNNNNLNLYIAFLKKNKEQYFDYCKYDDDVIENLEKINKTV